MDMYKKIAHIENEDDLKDVESELCDRFGPLPPPAKTLLGASITKSYAQMAKIKRVEQMRGQIRFFPDKIDMGILYQMSKVKPDTIKICGVGKAPYIMLVTDPSDIELTGSVDVLKTYIKKCKEIEQI
jgi:transcription-repair coupling factor (superfamily II helicase)